MSRAEATSLLTQALSVSDESTSQASLDRLLTLLKEEQQLITSVWPVVIALVADPRSTRTLQWAVAVLQLALTTQSSLSVDIKTNLSLPALNAVKSMLAHTTDPSIQKTGLQCFASMYPLLFKYACSGNDQLTWMNVVGLKTITLELWRKGSTGIKVAAVKVLQRIVQTQTKATADPRLQKTIVEPNLLMCKPNHAFLKAVQLEDEANKLLEELITTLFTSTNSDVISAVISTLAALVKSRPIFAQLVVTALSHWVPTAMVGQASPTQIRSTEKMVRTALTHLLKTNTISAFASQVTEFLARQSARMEVAAVEARQLRDRQEAEAARKRQLQAAEPGLGAEDPSAKRRRIDAPISPFRSGISSSIDLRDVFLAKEGPPNALAQFDASILPLNVCVDFLVASLASVEESALARAVAVTRARLPPPIPEEPPAPPPIKSEPIDPLQLDLGDEDLVLKEEPSDLVDAVGPLPTADTTTTPDREQEQEGDALPLINFESIDSLSSLVPAIEMAQEAKTEWLRRTVRRICRAGVEGGASNGIWVPLVARLVTRGLGEADEDEERQEGMREEMLEFVKEDLQGRMEFARLWLNEEWYVAGVKRQQTKKEDEEVVQERAYDRWLRKLLEHIMSKSSNKDRAFTQFVIDLPEIPVDEVKRLGEMCLRRDQVQLGFSALKELATLRPPARPAAVDVLLSLTTHKDKPTRNAAINTVKRWVPDLAALSESIISFAISLYGRLEVAPKPKEEEEAKAEGADDGEADMAMDMTPPPEEPKPAYALVRDAQIVDHLDPPETKEDVVRHVELLFALCHKYPDLLRPLFEGYAKLQPFAQEQILSLITPLIKSLGLENEKLLEGIDLAPEGSDALLLRVLNLLGDKLPRLPSRIIQSVKKIAKQRVLDPQFYVMIVSECDKDELKAYIPRIVTLLDGTPERKSLIRSVFLAATAPPSEKGAMASRSKINLLTAVELMSVLHQSEEISGLKPAIEAISICFSMTDAFRPEVLSAFMQHTLDSSPSIPTLFLRTVIQAVTTYKSALSSFISSTLLVKLINKKVWQSPPIWEGFIRLAKVVQPGSFKALLMLPREQLEDVVRRQPGLKDGLREVVKSGMGLGGDAGRDVLEVLGEGEEASVSQEPEFGQV